MAKTPRRADGTRDARRNVGVGGDRVPRTLIKKVARRPVLALWLYTVMMAASLGLAVYSLIDRAHIRSENRKAIIQVANSQCSSAATFRAAALENAKTDAQVKRVDDFFRKYNAATDEALRILGAPPCAQP